MTLVKGMTDYLRALRWILHPKVLMFAIVPGVLALLFSGLIYFSIKNYSDDLGQWMWGWYTWEWGSEFVDTMSVWVGGVIMAALAIMLFKYIILIVSSPFMSPLSERIESLSTGRHIETQFSIRTMSEGLTRGVRITIRNFSREIGLTIILLILSLFPLFSPFTSVLLLLVQAYFAGFGNMDFTMERYYRLPEAVRFVRSHKLYAIGNGLIFIGLLFIPFLGALIAVPLGAAAGTLGVLDRELL